MGACIGCANPKAGSENDDFHANLVSTRKGSSYKDLYVDGRNLGAGITGSVREVYHKRTKEKFAMKSINLSRIDKAQMQELETEINILKKLDHPNIIRIFEVYKSRRDINIVMEILNGGELSSRVLKTEKEIISVVTQLLSACKYWHSRGIVHRDLKLENVMFASKDKNARIKVIDFGLGTTFGTRSFHSNSINNVSNGSGLQTKASEDTSQNGKSNRSTNSSRYSMGKSKADLSKTKRMLMSTVGTAFYMSPEIVKGSGYTEACDLWAIGVIAYMLITLKPPFPGSSENEIFRHLLSGRPSFSSRRWKNVHPEAKTFVKHLLRVNPEDRWTAEEALKSDWLNLGANANESASIEDVDKEVISSLQRFTQYSKLRKAALMVIAHKSTGKHIEELRDAFLALDSGRTGTITFTELKTAMEKHQIDYCETKILELFQGLDMDKSGQIRYMEFLAATIETKNIITVSQLSTAFDHLDTDNSGYITSKNMKELLGSEFSEEEINEMIREADITGDNKVSREEFIKMMKKSHKKLRKELSQNILLPAAASIEDDSDSSRKSSRASTETSSISNENPEDMEGSFKSASEGTIPDKTNKSEIDENIPAAPQISQT